LIRSHATIHTSKGSQRQFAYDIKDSARDLSQFFAPQILAWFETPDCFVVGNKNYSQGLRPAAGGGRPTDTAARPAAMRSRMSIPGVSTAPGASPDSIDQSASPLRPHARTFLPASRQPGLV